MQTATQTAPIQTMPPTFDDQLANMKAKMPHYTKTCDKCGHVKTSFTERANDPAYVAAKQKNYRCIGKCVNEVKVETVSEVKVATPRANKPATVAEKIERATATGKKLRMAEMFALGRVKAGDVVTIRGKANTSKATVIDAKSVQFGDQVLTWNAYGEAVTGHKAVNIYVHAEIDGVLLDSLRQA